MILQNIFKKILILGMVLSVSGCGASGKLLGSIARLPVDLATGSKYSEDTSGASPLLINDGQNLNQL